MKPNAPTVLLVDDEPEVVDLICTMLDRHGIRTLRAASGNEARDIWNQHKDEISLLLTDQQMPGMGGDELALLLKEEKPGLKVIFISGHLHALPESAPKGAILLQKPFTFSELVETVKGALEGVS